MAGESVQAFAELQAVVGEAYASGTAPDRMFTAADLDGGALVVAGVTPGGARIVDADGRVVDAAQSEVMREENGIMTCAGTAFDLSPYLLNGALPGGAWRLRLVRGARGPEGASSGGEPPSDDVMLCSLIFG